MWFERFEQIEPGSDLETLARRFNTNYRVMHRWASLFGYPFTDRRCQVAPEDWDRVDWSLSDSEIARQLGISRERVRQVRAARGLPPSGHGTRSDPGGSTVS